ncbi:MAG TPA: sterol carrier family protein [Mycobacteriales bacterium]
MSVRLPSHEDALAGARAQFALLAEAVAGLPDDAFANPTRLEGWNVAALAAHVARTGATVTGRVERGTTGKPERDVLDYLSGMRALADEVAGRAVELGAARTPAELRDDVAAGAAALAGLDAPLTLSVPGYDGTLALGDFLVSRCVEGVVHGLDLAAATGVPERPDPTALKVCVRILAALAERAAPGKAVEVRVPGHVAFQCVTGPKHTRGTPGNVVECDPVAFVEVASGRTTWDAAVARGAIRGSGGRADLSEWMPVIG